jgi:hypothetical protein
MTDSIQYAIDKCASAGSGVVIFSKGIYLSGGIQLRSNITLQLDKGTIIRGSNKYSDYTNDAFIFGKDLSNITITGEGIIDGVNCYNPKGEEGFRGPHCIRLINCKNIFFKGITIKNSANWAINCRYCSNAKIENISIFGGHDGLHTRFCDNFKVRDCDFRTGDDAFAGNDNRNFIVKNCKINTSCNAFRMGCYKLLVKHCRIWGPGEYAHKIENRSKMPLAAFVHFSPKEEITRIPSGKWLIKDVTIDSADCFYMYNFENGLWQTGQPVTTIRFKKINATGLLRSFYIIGDHDRKFNLRIANSSFSYREGYQDKNTIFEGVNLKSDTFFYAERFGVIDLHNVNLKKATKNTLLECKSGNEINIKGLHCITGAASSPYLLSDIKKIIR